MFGDNVDIDITRMVLCLFTGLEQKKSQTLKTMRQEIASAVNFMSTFLSSRNGIPADEVDRFRRSLYLVLASRYSEHWFPERPCKGSAFRCIRIVKRRMDPVVSQAAVEAGIAESRVQELLPSELTLWVDPNDVSYRFGEDGSIGVLLDDSKSTKPESSSTWDIFDSCRNELLKCSDLVDPVSTIIAV